MKKNIFLLLLLVAGTCFSQTFYKQFPTALNLDYDVAAVEISNGYILGDNEVNSAANFHGVIRLIHTDYSGNITWAKQYDAGGSASVHLFQLLKTSDGYLLATGYTGPDNNSVASQRFAMKLDTSGNVLWSKQYSSSIAYQANSIVQLSDTDYAFSMGALSGGDPVLCRVDSSGSVLSAAKFNVTNSFINSIVIHTNSLDVILGSFYILNTSLSGSVINWQRQYSNTLQFNSLLSNRCANGDIIYMAGQIAGGFGDGTSRVFRTDSAGNLRWSKNILAWSGPSPGPGTNFDVVTHIAIKEDAGGNIIGVSLDEGGTLLFSVFDSGGSYLFNRNHMAVGQQHCVAETASGNYLTGSVFGFQSFSTFSSYAITPANSCDSILNVSITNGVDSIATMPPITVSGDTVVATNLSLASTAINISAVVYCNPAVGITKPENAGQDFSVYPNPTSDIMYVHMDNLHSAQIKIINVLGEVLLQRSVSNDENTIDLNDIKEGIYFIVAANDKYQVSRKLIVRRDR